MIGVRNDLTQVPRMGKEKAAFRMCMIYLYRVCRAKACLESAWRHLEVEEMGQVRAIDSVQDG